MNKTAFIILIIGSTISVLGGCAVQREVYEPDVLPRLRDYQPIIYTSPVLNSTEYRVTVQMNIDEEGNVVSAALRKPTGSKDFDDSILTAVQRWKYYPAEVKGQPVPLAMSQQITIKFEPSVLYTLAEIVVPRSTLADSLLHEIENGIEFEDLARKFSNSRSANIGGYLGSVELKNFRPDIYQVVRKLYPGDISAPLTVDHSYIIYKRIK
jgi:TonB family protein